MFPIRLEWKRPTEGVKIVHDVDWAVRDRYGDGRVARATSGRFEPIEYELLNLEDPMVLHFIRCRDDNDRARFLARFGFFWRGQQEAAISDFEHGQRVMRGLLSLVSPEFPVQLFPIGEAGLWHDITLKPVLEIEPLRSRRLVLQPDSLASYMGMEIAFALEVGAARTTCERCGKSFLTGSRTGRRSHALYCSDRCRVAAMRQRNAAKEGG
jgi:hypothetical protein